MHRQFMRVCCGCRDNHDTKHTTIITIHNYIVSEFVAAVVTYSRWNSQACVTLFDNLQTPEMGIWIEMQPNMSEMGMGMGMVIDIDMAMGMGTFGVLLLGALQVVLGVLLDTISHRHIVAVDYKMVQF